MNQRFLHGLPVTIYRHYGSIHLVGAMAGKARLLPLSSGHDAGEPAGNMSVPRYWRKVLSGAWDKTYKPLDWTGKKAAVVLVAVGTIILAGVHLGPGATFASVSGYLWIIAPIAFAALVLFIWGALQTTAELYAELYTTSRTRTTELEAALAEYQKPPPDYEAWRHVDRLTLREAAFLWCDLSPGPSMPPNVHAWFNAFSSAIQRGELPFEHQPRAHVHAETERQLEKRNPTLSTVVMRAALQRFAKANDHYPIFLRNI